MATVQETIVTGRKYRIWDAVNNIWKRISYWTKASDVEYEDGLNGEDKIQQIDNDKINKTNLVFTLDGNDLYITKTY